MLTAIQTRFSSLQSLPDQSSTAPKWFFDTRDRVLQLSTGHKIHFERKQKSWQLHDSHGKEVSLANTKLSITSKHKSVGDGRAKICEQLQIYDGEHNLLVTGIAKNQILVEEQVAGVKFASTKNTSAINRPKLVFQPAPAMPVETLPATYGAKPGQDINKKLTQFRDKLTSLLQQYKKTQADPKNIKKKAYYQDLINAVQGDLGELQNRPNLNKVDLFNRLNKELFLEVKYNVNLTHADGQIWTASELNSINNQLKLLPIQRLLSDPKLHEIQLGDVKKNVGGYNTDSGLIVLLAGAENIRSYILHEIGHNFDDENPKWKDFQALSGWQDVTSKFSSISSDYDANDAYKPWSGTAFSKLDGKTYHDGDEIDIGGDGKIDGIVQVQSGKVMIQQKNADFITDYAEVNPKEDFAESFKFFFTNPQRLHDQCPDKYQFMVGFAGRDPLKVATLPNNKPPLF